MGKQRLELVIALLGIGSPCGGATVRPESGFEQPAPATVFSYSTGRGVQNFAVPAEVLKSAVLEAMDDLNMNAVHRERNGLVTQIDGRTSDGRSVVVTIRPQVASFSVSCRIG